MLCNVCENLNNSICFNAESIGITYCTLTNATNGLGWPKIPDNVFVNNVIDWDKFFEERKKEIENIKNSTPRKECENCQQITRQEYTENNKIKYILLSQWQVCNSDCIYCLGHIPPLDKTSQNYDEQYKKFVEPYDIIAILKDMISKDILDKNAKIDFAGGEPTLYPRFDELINFLLDNNFNNIIIHTNNIQYSKAIENGIKKNAISLMISIDAGSKKCHRIVKRVDSFNNVWHNFKKYTKSKTKDYSGKLCTKYVIVPDVNDSEKEISEFIKQSKKHGATHVALNVYNQLLNNMNYEVNLLNHLYNLSEFFIKEAEKQKLNHILFPNISYVYTKLSKN